MTVPGWDKQPRRTRTRRKSPAPKTGSCLQRIVPAGLVLVAVVGVVLLVLWYSEPILDAVDTWLAETPVATQPTTRPRNATPAVIITGDNDATGQIRPYFTTPDLIYPDQRTQRRAPQFERDLVADIDAAQTSVDLATYEYNLASIAEALARAEQRGVRVRTVLDGENGDSDASRAWLQIVENAGITPIFEQTDSFMHSKFVVIDAALVWTGSWNMTTNETYRNNNNLLRISAPELVDNYVNEFERLAAGLFLASEKDTGVTRQQIQLGAITIENHFSPQDGAERYVVQRLLDAEKSIEFMTFAFTSDPIGDAIRTRENAGVLVRGVFERRNTEATGSEYTRLRRAGAEVLTDGNCYTMHHKVIIIDGRIVITGSYNFTSRADRTNTENLLIIDDPVLAKAYQQEFRRVFAQAQNPTVCQ